jgi:hypothetical protein
VTRFTNNRNRRRGFNIDLNKEKTRPLYGVRFSGNKGRVESPKPYSGDESGESNSYFLFVIILASKLPPDSSFQLEKNCI